MIKRAQQHAQKIVPAVTNPVKGMIPQAGVQKKPSPSDKSNSKTMATKALEVFKKNKPIAIILAVFVLIFLVLIILLVVSGVGKDEGGLPGLSVPTQPVPSITRKGPAHPIYSKDPDILKIEESLDELESDLLNANLHESSINPPLIDLDINFKQ